MLNDKTIARNFTALAHPRRAMIFRLLAVRPELGESQKTLLAATSIPYASFAHHINRLQSAGLVRARHHRGTVSYAISTDEFAEALRTAIRLSDGTLRSRPRAA